ncbi:MAG: YtfJ family protein [Bacteriovoracaceae bacterium]|nr:YtfJ family protein [Bacteriovoracaceae bacterium]
MKPLLLLLFTIFLSSINANELVGKALPDLVLSGDDGGKLDGKEWSLKEAIAQNKVTVIFYVDPDVKDKNEDISQRLSKRDFSKEKVQYIGMINMEATWLPNFAIAGALKKKQKKYPNTLYLKDLTKKAVTTWKVADDENDIIILDKTGKVAYAKFGLVSKEEGDKILALIEKLKED